MGHEHESPGGQRMAREPMVMMARDHYAPYRWVQAATAFLGLWLIAGPLTFAYGDRRLFWSDLLSGVVVLALAAVATRPRNGLASWAQAVVGLWLLVAPLVFWAPEPSVYATNTLIGALLIAFGFLIPMGMEMEGADVPPGWSYNPSTWPQRAPIIGLGVVSFFAARHMAAVQLGYRDVAWEPFFGGGTQRVLESEVSRAWPVSDAGLGAATYLIEALSGFMGDKRRWRTMPWMVAMFGFIVVPLGVVSIVLVILQPLAVGDWCTLCLATAALMLAMIPLTLDEVAAMAQFVLRRRREGASAWRTFWLGGDHPGEDTGRAPRPQTWAPRGMLWGVSVPWPLAAAAALGVWLMFAPAVFGSTGAMADSDHLVGPLVTVFAVMAWAEVGRPLRFVNVLAGAWLIAAPFVLDGGSALARLNTVAVGLVVVALSLPLGRVKDHYGTFDRWLPWNPLRRQGFGDPWS